jgi:glycine cleavage system protein P-like pyridoxal-binding family
MNRLESRMHNLEARVSKQVTMDDVMLHMNAGDYEEWAGSLPVEAFHDLDTFLNGIREVNDERA